MNYIKQTCYFLGHALDSTIRHQASSGGIGSSIQKYLLESKDFGTTITFAFNTECCMYEPKLIYNSDEINICGSIYQDINIYKFIKEKINEIRGGIIVSCPPCQVKPIKHLLDKANIKNFIISFCCSGQTSIEGTWKYYQLQGIKKDNVNNIQYRGNGWPSGIQIITKDGLLHKWDNWSEPWTTIHKSYFYRPRRCFFCTFDTSYKSDVSLADPWITSYLNNDHEGNTIVVVNTEYGLQVIQELIDKNIITLDNISFDIYEIAQKNNLAKKDKVLSQQKYLKILLLLTRNKLYRSIFTKSFISMKLHIKIMRLVYYFSTMSNFTMFKRIFKKIKQYD